MLGAAATLFISNQMNGHAGACVHHKAILGVGKGCTVRVLRNMNAFLCSYWDDVGRDGVTNNNIRYAVKFAAKALNYPGREIPLRESGGDIVAILVQLGSA